MFGSCRKKSSRRLFARTAKETENFFKKTIEFYDIHKCNVARAVLNALKCIDKLGEEKDPPADLKQVASIEDLKKTLQTIADAEPQPAQVHKQEKDKSAGKRGRKKVK